ncbi:SIP domain-containing protein [Microbacterium saperdae]
MPTFPALVGTLAEALSGYSAHVLDIAAPARGFLYIEFRASPPTGGWQPGHEIQIMATSTQARRYTAYRVTGHDRLGILVALDADGPGTAWVRRLRRGEDVTLVATKHRPLRLPPAPRLILGDGSALGTIDAYARAVPSSIVALETAPSSVAALRERWPQFQLLPARTEPGTAIQAWLEEAVADGRLNGIHGALLLGHAGSLQQQRRMLVGHGLLDRRAVTTKPYWATGRAGL